MASIDEIREHINWLREKTDRGEEYNHDIDKLAAICDHLLTHIYYLEEKVHNLEFPGR